MKSVGECKYHVVNCFEHSINALKELEIVLNDKDFSNTSKKTCVKLFKHIY